MPIMPIESKLEAKEEEEEEEHEGGDITGIGKKQIASNIPLSIFSIFRQRKKKKKKKKKKKFCF